MHTTHAFKRSNDSAEEGRGADRGLHAFKNLPLWPQIKKP